MRLTKEQMVKDIFFLATSGQRTADNYVQGMAVIEAVARYNYRDIIETFWKRVSDAGDVATAKTHMRSLATLSFYNIPAVYRDMFLADRRKFNF